MPIAFVTGANGFLGATLVRCLLAAGWEARCLVRPGANDLLLRELPIVRVDGDLLQPETYRQTLAGCDALFHTAASYTHDPSHLAAMTAVNVEGTRLILTLAADTAIPRIVHTSTIGTIGQPTDGSLATEDIPFNLPSPTAYVHSKLAAEEIALHLARQGAPIIIVHPTAMLGAGDWRPTASGRRVLDVLNAHSLRYPRGGINWAPVMDVAQGLMLAAARGQPGRRYILGHGAGNLDSDDFARLVRQAASLPPTTRPRTLLSRLRRDRARYEDAGMQGRKGSDLGAAPDRLTCDPTRAIVELGLPQTSLLLAAQAEVAWYRQHGYIS